MRGLSLALGLAGALSLATSVGATEATYTTSTGKTVVVSTPTSTTTAQSSSAPSAQVSTVTTSAPAVNAQAVQASQAAEAVSVAAEVKKEDPKIDKGDTAWLLISAALVLMMTLPGLALFYSGMVRKKNVLSMMMSCFSAAGLVSIIWVVIGYSLAFGVNDNASWAPYIGGLSRVMMDGIGVNTLWQASDPAKTQYFIPESLFSIYQMTFAIITVAIMAGGVAERMKYSAFMVFIGLWALLVYSPIAHWVWSGQGWLFAKGELDYAGGTVVHINSGIAGLIAAYMVGKRLGLGREMMAPHNLVLTLVGTGLLWVGWIGFNAGSGLAADGRAAMAAVTTQVAAAMGMITWLVIERWFRGKSSVLGAASGAVAGLVGITPAAGYVTVASALVIGLITAVVCFWAVTALKRILGADDALDAFGVHAIGGITGSLLTGILATDFITQGAPAILPVGEQLMVQIVGVLSTVIYTAVVTFILLKIIDGVMGLRVSEEEERAGLDISQHGEHVE